MCLRKNKLTEKIELALCSCKKCIDIFDIQLGFSFDKRELCSTVFGDNCLCFEISHTTLALEVSNYQVHDICNECKYDSHCSWLAPGA